MSNYWILWRNRIYLVHLTSFSIIVIYLVISKGLIINIININTVIFFIILIIIAHPRFFTILTLTIYLFTFIDSTSLILFSSSWFWIIQLSRITAILNIRIKVLYYSISNLIISYLWRTIFILSDTIRLSLILDNVSLFIFWR